MKICVIGGDGFCGWPTALHLSARGHDVVIVDNLSRRKIDIELEVESLTPIKPMSVRLAAWREVFGKSIEFENIDVARNYARLAYLFTSFAPDAIVHFAEQRAAPYSMKSSFHKRYTVDNNLNATNNILAAMVETGIGAHLVHLGTMGVYGYGTAGVKIPEGYLTVKIEKDNGEEVAQEILYPANPGSIYHMTKTQDQLMFAFYNKNDGLKITDLHQGIVWGTQTRETKMDERLINRFDYDGDYGTVLNRFLMQAAIGYPLTVHGTGGQTRAFIHIQDTVRCIELAIENPPQQGERVRILNQMTESHRVRDLAALVAGITGAGVEYVKNPRKEDAENELHVENRRLLGLGLEPVTLQNGLLEEVTDIAKRFSGRCDLSKSLACPTGRPTSGRNSRAQARRQKEAAGMNEAASMSPPARPADAEAAMFGKLIIQIPCLNEADTLPVALAALPRAVEGFEKVEWLVIDDGSTDDTVSVARAHGVDHVISFPQNRGLARAYMAGLEECLRLGADVIVNTDADNQYDASCIPDLVRPILEKRAQIVVGARPIEDIRDFSPLKKRLQRFGSWVVQLASGTKIPDAPSGFRAVTREAAAQLNVFNNYTYTLETIIQAGRKGIPITSVPIRVNGFLRPSRLISSIPKYIWRSVLTIARIFIIYKPARFFGLLSLIAAVPAIAVILRFLVLFAIGEAGQHLQSLILGAGLLAVAAVLAVTAVLADLVATNRLLLEDIRRRILLADSLDNR